MPKWIGAGGRIINMDFIRSFQIEKKGDLYNVIALTESSISKEGLVWEIVATCTTDEQAFGYIVYLLKDDLINSEGGHPRLRRQESGAPLCACSETEGSGKTDS
jgi:hypothetical protein